MATPIKSKFGSYKHEFKTARTPRQKERYDQFVRTKDDFRPKDKSGYMIFEGFDKSEAELEAFRQMQAEFEYERVGQLIALQAANEKGETLMAFHSANPGWNQYKPWQTAQAQRAVARDEAYTARIIEKERKQDEQMKALIKHRSVIKQMNLQPVAGTMKEVAATREKTERLRAEALERARLVRDEEIRKVRLAEEEWQKKHFSYTPKPRKQPSYQTVAFNAPRRKRPEELLSPEDVEMYDILNELQQ